MKNRKKITVGPVSKFLSLMPLEDSFDENWYKTSEGAWISDQHWNNVNGALSKNESDEIMRIRAEVNEYGSYGMEDSGVWLTTENIMNIENALNKVAPLSLSKKDKPMTAPFKVESVASSKKDEPAKEKKVPAYLDPNSPENAWFDRQTKYYR